MARGRGRRDAHDITNGTLLDLIDPEPLPLNQVEDRRFDTPEVSPIPRTRAGRPSKVVPAPIAKNRKGRVSKAYSLFNQMAFQAPLDVVVCVRRQQRKEVFHAKGYAGGKVKPPRRGSWSSIHCRRK